MNCPRCNASDQEKLVVRVIGPIVVTNPLGMRKYNEFRLPVALHTAYLKGLLEQLLPNFHLPPLPISTVEVPTLSRICFGCGFKKVELFAK